MKREDFDEFVDYDQPWCDCKYIKLLHSTSKHKREGGMYIYLLSQKSNRRCIVFDNEYKHVLEGKLRRILNVPDDDNHCVVNLTKNKLWEFVSLILKRSDTEHVLGFMCGGENRFYRIHLKGDATI